MASFCFGLFLRQRQGGGSTGQEGTLGFERAGPTFVRNRPQSMGRARGNESELSGGEPLASEGDAGVGKETALGLGRYELLDTVQGG